MRIKFLLEVVRKQGRLQFQRAAELPFFPPNGLTVELDIGCRVRIEDKDERYPEWIAKQHVGTVRVRDQMTPPADDLSLPAVIQAYVDVGWTFEFMLGHDGALVDPESPQKSTP